MSVIREVEISGKKITLEFNKYAKQANGSVMVTSGGTQVLVTVCAAEEAAPGQDFFPLGVDYIEKYYAAGRIPGGFRKRENRPGDVETLNARVIDRPLRPSFPENYMCETTITCTVVSYEHGNTPTTLALLGASTALMISDIPFNGPVASLRLGMKDGEFIVDPPEGEITDLDLNIAANPGGVLMVEAGANFLSEEKMLEAISHAHELMRPLFDMQIEIQKEIGKPKRALPSDESGAELLKTITDYARDRLGKAYEIKEKLSRSKAIKEVLNGIRQEINSQGDETLNKKIKELFETVNSNFMRSMILETGSRIDGRSSTDIRKITCETGVLVKPHGSALFTRGETQALAVVTLGSADDMQRSETLYNSDLKERFMLYYNFPPFSVGEARMQRPPGRREIGHGALARRALEPVIPSAEDFGYTIRLVSEVLESNGSSSMATVCGGTLALLKAGVPLKEPVAGIAMGLIKEGDKYAILSDILGDEDHLGDMDFKVCGGKEGLTALQMDIKIGGLTKEIMKKALDQAKAGRLHILEKMNAEISEPSVVSGNAPRIFKVKIESDKIRDVIGPGGKNIKRIVSETGAKIDIDDSGIVSIVAPDAASAEAAKSMIRSYTTDPEIGAIYLGTVVRVVDFGAFIQLRPGVEGLCHISQLAEHRVNKVEDIIKEGEEVLVSVLDIDRQGRVKLSRKDALGKKPTVTN
jgi:polyribonucleotide nucleotidyltransferase